MAFDLIHEHVFEKDWWGLNLCELKTGWNRWAETDVAPNISHLLKGGRTKPKNLQTQQGLKSVYNSLFEKQALWCKIEQKLKDNLEEIQN